MSDRSRAGRRLVATLSLTAAALVCALALPIGAWASLPDNRIYEQVSPANKDGNVLFPTEPFSEEFGARLGAEGGNAVMYASTGAIGAESNQGGFQESISRRVPGVGWVTEPADSRQLGQLGLLQSPEMPAFYAGAEDFRHVYFDPLGCCAGGEVAYVPEEPASGLDFKLYAVENPFTFPTWIGKPQIEKPIPAPGEAMPKWLVGGVSADGSTMYFNYSGTLLPEDELEEKAPGQLVPGKNSRAGHVGEGTGGGPWGLYEWSNGKLSEAGQLPNGKLSQYGAITAADAAASRGFEKINPEENDGQVSEDGKRIFFVSPDPQGGAPASESPELYMRETLANGEHKTILVSRDPLLAKVKETNSKGVEEEFPAQAPGGVSTFNNASGPETGGSTYAWASPDGSRVFFASSAALTSQVTAHSEFELWLGYSYSGGNFKLEVTANSSTQTTAPIKWEATPAEVQSALEALSNVGAGKVEVVAGTSAGVPHEYKITFPSLTAAMELNVTEMVGNAGHYVHNLTKPNMYEFDAATEELTYLPEVSEIAASSKDGSRVMFRNTAGELNVMSEGAKGPEVQTIVSEIGSVTPARAAADGSSFMFYASSGGKNSQLSKFNNGGYDQFYHYSVANKELVCVSCPPVGVNATGAAETNFDSTPHSLKPVRMMSEDGTRIFFQSPDALVGADINGLPDVYEWENGHLYLISGGNALVGTHYVDNSATGGDVFFLTSQGLVPSDEDEQTDMYDARIPRPGDNPPVTETPCSGEVCQGPPSVPQLLSPAASATFEGLGNIPPEAVKEAKEEVTKPPVVKCKKGYVNKNGKCIKQKKKKKAKKGKKSAKGNRRGK